VEGDRAARTAGWTRKGQATRDRIVAAAAQLMFERGVAGTTTEDVRAAAGVSSSQLYHYFADKRVLVRAVIGFTTDAVLDAQQQLGELDSLDALRSWRNFVVDLQRQRSCQGGCPIGSLASELADEWPEARDELAQGFERWEAQIRCGLRAMHDRGDLHPDADPDHLALATLAALQGGLLLTKTRRDTAPLEAALDAMIDHIASLTN
jgi:AcrR family transcriptional regulator